jgi:hypothetical protein
MWERLDPTAQRPGIVKTVQTLRSDLDSSLVHPGPNIGYQTLACGPKRPYLRFFLSVFHSAARQRPHEFPLNSELPSEKGIMAARYGDTPDLDGLDRIAPSVSITYPAVMDRQRRSCGRAWIAWIGVPCQIAIGGHKMG